MSTMLVVMLVNGLGRLGQKRPLHLPLSPLLFGWLRTRLCRTCGPHLQCDVQQILCSVGRLDASKPVQLCSQKPPGLHFRMGTRTSRPLCSPQIRLSSSFLLPPGQLNRSPGYFHHFTCVRTRACPTASERELPRGSAGEASSGILGPKSKN